MKASKKAKDFDCVEMKNAIQAQIYAEIKNMTREERLAYFNHPLVQGAAQESAATQAVAATKPRKP
jgi:hypothetical protein